MTRYVVIVLGNVTLRDQAIAIVRGMFVFVFCTSANVTVVSIVVGIIVRDAIKILNVIKGVRNVIPVEHTSIRIVSMIVRSE